MLNRDTGTSFWAKYRDATPAKIGSCASPTRNGAHVRPAGRPASVAQLQPFWRRRIAVIRSPRPASASLTRWRIASRPEGSLSLPPVGSAHQTTPAGNRQRDRDDFRRQPALDPLRGRDVFRLMMDLAMPSDPFARRDGAARSDRCLMPGRRPGPAPSPRRIPVGPTHVDANANAPARIGPGRQPADRPPAAGHEAPHGRPETTLSLNMSPGRRGGL